MQDSHREPLLLRAARNLAVESRPVWIMRQAGRYLPEYRELREKVSFMQLCKTPELALRASLMPLKRFAVDGAIVFSDILPVIEAMGGKVSYEGSQPQIPEPIQTHAQVEALTPPESMQQLDYVFETIRMLKAEVGNRQTVIGFAGAPFTLAAYMVEGKGANFFTKVRRLLYESPQTYHLLARKLAHTIALYLEKQVEAGAQIVQLFDTWAGLLSPKEYRTFALPYEKLALSTVRQRNTPTSLYINGCGHLLPLMSESGADVLSVDWRVDMAAARDLLGNSIVLQGNLNPATLFATDGNELNQQVQTILSAFPDGVGHIFNLGHGILPQTPIDNVKRMIAMVKEADNGHDRVQ